MRDAVSGVRVIVVGPSEPEEDFPPPPPEIVGLGSAPPPPNISGLSIGEDIKPMHAPTSPVCCLMGDPAMGDPAVGGPNKGDPATGDNGAKNKAPDFFKNSFLCTLKTSLK